MLIAKKSSHSPSEVRDVEAINAEALIERRLSPGMLVLAPPMRLIHMNQTAWEFIQRMSEEAGDDEKDNGGRPKKARGLLPGPLRDLCNEIMDYLRERPHAKDWERFEMKRLIGHPTQPILLRGFGIPDESGRDQARVVLLIEDIGRRREAFRSDSINRFQLTEREQSVVQCLTKGWTNKEIAGALKLALPTVKEHIRHIMEKTKTSTRTGILVEIFYK